MRKSLLTTSALALAAWTTASVSAQVSSVAVATQGDGDEIPVTKTIVFEETFPNCKSTTIQGGYFSESLYFDAETMGDHEGWVTQNCYESERAIKFSAKTKDGWARTPAIDLYGESGDITVSFRAQTWKGDDLVINVQVDGMPETKQVVDLGDTKQISNRDEVAASVTFTNVPTGFKIRFDGTGKEGGTGVTRFFLGDVVVYQHMEGDEVPASLSATTSYHHFNDIMAGNESERRIVSVYGVGDAAGDAELTLPENSNFKIASVAHSDCWPPESIFELQFDPRNAGAKEEVAVISVGDFKRNLILTGNAKVYRPEQGEGVDVKGDSFTATWPEAAGMDNIELVAWTLEEGELVAPDLMITKYIEGKSNNRALEIYNGTDRDIDLIGYKLVMENNGAGGFTFGEFAFPDITLNTGKTYTIANANFEAVREIADKTIGYQDGGYANIVTFTGDDAIGLFNPEGKLIDVIGYESTDVNDRVSGLWGTDVSYYRRSDCYEPQSKFYPEQWETHEMDYCEGYGTHEMDTYGDVRREVKRVMLPGDATSAVVDGLEPQTTYYFTVRGLSSGISTHYAPVASVTTGEGSGVASVASGAAWSLSSGVLTVAEGAEVYALDGALLGRGSVALSGHGVAIVRAADGRVAKVVY